MARFFRAVNGLLHGTQTHGLDDGEVGTTTSCGHDFGVIGRSRLIAPFQCQPQATQVLAQGFQLGRRGAFVHTVQTIATAPSDKVGSTCIGCQHALFNQLVRVVTDQGLNAFDATQGVAHNLGFNRIEINCATCSTALGQQAVQGVQVLHRLQHVLNLGGSRASRLLQGAPDIGIRGARM